MAISIILVYGECTEQHILHTFSPLVLDLCSSLRPNQQGRSAGQIGKARTTSLSAGDGLFPLLGFCVRVSG